jgi:class 3 adenylate cyclase/tetratricopeptide (TPR) repeat protein
MPDIGAMSDHPVSQTLASYLPALVLRRLQSSAEANETGTAEPHHGAVIFADVNGFTAITERLAQQGAVGAEQLSRLLNDYFGQAIRQIDAAGGDIVRFAGDAILAVWPAVDETQLESAAVQAANCALRLQARLRDYQSDDGTSLTMKIGVGAGEFCVMHLGGEFERREFLVTGPAFEQSFAAVEDAQPGQVVASPPAWQRLGNEFAAHESASGAAVLAPFSRQGDAPGNDSSAESLAGDDPITVTSLPAESRIRAYVSGTVTAQLEAGQEDWLADLRVVSVMFVNLPDLNYTTPIDRAQEIFRCLQQELYRYEGTINKLNVDDKGTSLLAAMGLPPLAHEDDARRAVVAALAIRRRLDELGACCSIGVTTGRAFCGSVGNQRRREYTLVGDVVNLSARLMQTAPGEIRCDQATHRAAELHVEFQQHPDVKVKGKAQPVRVFEPVGRKGSVVVAHRQLVGRDRECGVLREKLESLLAQHAVPLADGDEEGDGDERPTASVVVVEGEPGIGKSGLVMELLHLAGSMGVATFVGNGDSIETTTLYHAWKTVLNDALELGSTTDAPARRRARLLLHLEHDPELLNLAPLLSTVLSLELADNENTRHMSGRVRGENARFLAKRLIAAVVGRRPTMIVVEDLQWLDSASWSLVEELARDVGPLLLVLTGRSIVQTAEQFQEVIRAPQATMLSLGRLSREETGKLLAHCLSVDTVSETLTRLVYDRAGGNPLFSEQLAVVVRNALEKFQSADDGANFESRFHTAVLSGEMNWPDTLHGAITGTIDRLEPPAQLAIKVAGVIGRRFSYQALHDNYPYTERRPQVRDYMAAGLRANLVEVALPEAPITYAFRHVITQQVAYNLLLFRQRRELHRSIAQWFESNQDFHVEARSAVLAHHWERAGATAEALRYAAQAAETAYENGAYSEAVFHYQTTLRLDQQAVAKANKRQRAGWERRLGESHLGMGDLAQSKVHLERALAAIDRAAPSTPVSLAVRVGLQMVVQLVRRLMPRAVREFRLSLVSTARRPELLEAAHAYERLGEVLYLANERGPLVHAVLSALNLAEAAGRSPQLARTYANSCFAAGLGGLHWLARSYAADARAASDETVDPAAAAWVQEVTGVYQLGMAELASSRASFARAIEIYERIGDWQHWGENVAAAAQAAYFQGDVPLGEQTWQRLFDRAKTRGDELQMAWGLNGRAEALLRRGGSGHAEQAVGLLEQAVRLLTKNVDRVSKLGSLGLLAVAQLRCDNQPEAARAAAAGLELSDELAAPTGYYTINGYAHVAQTYLTLWEAGYAGETDSMASLSARACRALDRYAATFPLGRPSALLCRAQLKWLGGRERQAHAAWRKCVTIARRLEIPHQRGLALYEIARHLKTNDPDRQLMLDRSREIFETLGAGYELERIRCLGETLAPGSAGGRDETPGKAGGEHATASSPR